ncbi:hypothetical protein M231_05187 [Tremella mesenterica]|uniref:Uncharacterized protein n=1 Tax=Tremella mesenterica TaxID=5217 RepID=A0A4Q1BIZ3_TREME|nr:hypothetical protein M231_05187 [Tremella mesenterica]
MYATPTPATRRPRPPGSRARRLSNSGRLTTAHVHNPDKQPATYSPQYEPPTNMSTLPSTSSVNSTSETPLAAYVRARRAHSRSQLARVSASPDLSNASPIHDTRNDSVRSRPSQVGMGLPSSLRTSLSSDAQPSPPPPYGQDLPHDSTPRREEREGRERTQGTPADTMEERLRMRRATDAAKALGLDMEFGFDTEPGTPSSEIGLTEDEIKAKLSEAKRLLKRRDNELLMAARVADQVLRRHEQLVAGLPPSLRASLPGLGELMSARKSREGLSRSNSFQGSPAPPHIRTSTSNQEFPPSAQSQRSSRFRPTYDVPIPTPNPENRFFRTVRSSDTSMPFPFHNQRHRPKMIDTPGPSPDRVDFAAIQLQENEERLAAMEHALTEARESEEAQRKLAARLRKDFEKLQREYDRAEALMSREDHVMGYGTPRDRPKPRTEVSQESWGRSVSHNDRSRIKVAQPKTTEEDEVENVIDRFGWGTTTFPEFPASAGPSRPSSQGDTEDELREVMEHLSVRSNGSILSSRRSEASPSVSLRTRLDEETSSVGSADVATVHRASSVSRQEAHHLQLPLTDRKIRRRVSKSNFLDPSQPTQTPIVEPLSPLAPRVTLQAPNSPQSSFSSSSTASQVIPSSNHSHKRSPSPYPSPQHSDTSTVSQGLFGMSPTPSPHPLPPMTSLMAMRAYMSNISLNRAPSRTLGSELGSDFGDEWAIRSFDERSRTEQGSEEDDFEDPQPLPPNVSAALSSLALALAPSIMFGQTDSSVPILPKGSLREPGLDHRAYALLSEAVRMRKIRWADQDIPIRTSQSTPAGLTNLKSIVKNWQTPSDPWEGNEYPDDLSTTSLSSVEPSLSRSRSRSRSPTPTPTLTSRPSLALAHRRSSSIQTLHTIHNLQALQVSISRSQAKLHFSPSSKKEIQERYEKLDNEREPNTIPGRVVNDIICLLFLVLDWIEMLAVAVYRVIMDIRYGQRATL